MPLLSIADPSRFTPEVLARAIYESAPILYRRVNLFLDWALLSPMYQRKRIGVADQLRANLVARGVTSSSRTVLQPNRFNAAEWAACWRLAIHAPEDDEPVLVRSAVDLMQRTLERLVVQGVLAHDYQPNWKEQVGATVC